MILNKSFLTKYITKKRTPKVFVIVRCVCCEVFMWTKWFVSHEDIFSGTLRKVVGHELSCLYLKGS